MATVHTLGRSEVRTPAQAYRYMAEALQMTVDVMRPQAWSQFALGQIAAAESTIDVLGKLAKMAEKEGN